MTVNEIDCKTSLTINGKPPLDGSAIEMLQSQIIAPKQEIIINAVQGNDDTGDGTYAKPFKTIAKALSKRNTNVPKLQLMLYVETGNEIYHISPIDCSRVSQQAVTIEAYPWTTVNNLGLSPTLDIGYGKIFAEDFTGTTRYHWGNILCANVNSLYLAGLKIKISNSYSGKGYVDFVCSSNSLRCLQCVFDIGTHTLWKLNDSLEQKIVLSRCSFSDNCKGFIAKAFVPRGTTTDPSITNTTNTTNTTDKLLSLANVTIANKWQISSSIYLNDVVIPNTVLNNGNKGYNSDVDITYKNWS